MARVATFVLLLAAQKYDGQHGKVRRHEVCLIEGAKVPDDGPQLASRIPIRSDSHPVWVIVTNA